MSNEQSHTPHEGEHEEIVLRNLQEEESENNEQDSSLIYSLQESLKLSQDIEVNLLRNEKILNEKIYDMQMRERELERDLSFLKERPRSRSRDRQPRYYRHDVSHHYRERRSPSRPRHSRYRERRSPSRHHYSRYYERSRRSPSHRQRSRSPLPRHSPYRDQVYHLSKSSTRQRSPSASRSHRSNSSSSSQASPFEGFSVSDRPPKRRIVNDIFPDQSPSKDSFSGTISNPSGHLDTDYDLGSSHSATDRCLSDDRPREQESSFPHKGETYIVFDPNFHQHVDNNPSQIFWKQEKISVKWYEGEGKAFCQINEETSSHVPYVTSKTAVQLLRDDLGLSPYSESTGFKRQSLSTHFDPVSGLGLTLSIAESTEELLLHHLVTGDRKLAMTSFKEVSFEAPTTTIFSSGWPKGNHHFKWANGIKLDLTKAALQLNIDTTDSSKKKIFNPLLDRELETRTNLVNQITGLRSLELFSEKFKEGDNKRSTTLAIAKSFIPVLKTLIVDWMEAKMNLRKSILHNQDTETVRILLKSDMWDPFIFSAAAIEELKNFKESGLRKLLNLNKDGSFRKPHFNKGRSSHLPKTRPHYDSSHRTHQSHRHKKEEPKKSHLHQPFHASGSGKIHSNSKPDPPQFSQQGSSHKNKSSHRGRFKGKNK